jgi:hypothetical protein
MNIIKLTFCLLLVILGSGCSQEDLEDLADSVDVPRKKIDVSRTGLNAFGNDREFGTPCDQFQEVSQVLGLRYIRMLINWNSDVQPSPTSSPEFGFYDNLVNCIPEGVDALLIVNGLPGWMYDSSNWIAGNPRATFVERWFRKVFSRYHANPRVVGFQIWNEPNMLDNGENVILEMAEAPENYVEMLAGAYSLAKNIDATKLIVNAATTSINQDYPNTLQYNERMKDAGAVEFLDKYAIHYYGEQFERVGRLDSFVNSIGKGIWLTESGERGINAQLGYVETAWPFLDEKFNNIERFYYYQHTSIGDPNSVYGLRNNSAAAPISDLYIYLRDKKLGLVE